MVKHPERIDDPRVELLPGLADDLGDGARDG
jgi:hypothetical protein